jgi:iron(II)-dependent oxidoreductase
LPPGWKDGAIPEGKENQALVCVSWEDAQKYCEWVSKETGWTVTLPTEAQWEKAASWDSKKNQKFAYPWGNRWDEKLCNNGFWVEKRGLHWETNEQYEAFKKTPAGRQFVEAGGNTMAVGSFKGGQSPYGCHDMAGNAFEWCADWFTTEYHLLKDAKKNPQGPDEMAADELVSYGQRCKVRVMRGGSWRNTFRGCSTTHRDYLFPTARGYMFGFRIVVVSRVR